MYTHKLVLCTDEIIQKKGEKEMNKHRRIGMHIYSNGFKHVISVTMRRDYSNVSASSINRLGSLINRGGFIPRNLETHDLFCIRVHFWEV